MRGVDSQKKEPELDQAAGSQKKAFEEPELHQLAERGEHVKFSELLEGPGVDIFALNGEGLTVLALAENAKKKSSIFKRAPFEKIIETITNHLFFKLCEAMQKSDEQFEHYFQMTK